MVLLVSALDVFVCGWITGLARQGTTTFSYIQESDVTNVGNCLKQFGSCRASWACTQLAQSLPSQELRAEPQPRTNGGYHLNSSPNCRFFPW